jgi:Ankyrin repeats (many copies)
LVKWQRLAASLAADVRAARPGLVVWAAATGSRGAIELLVELGFDVNAMGRADGPSDQPWQTALHKAADDGDLELARTLLRLGADPDLKDARFGGTPLGGFMRGRRRARAGTDKPTGSPEVCNR